MDFGDFSWNLSGINILIFFSKFELLFAVSGLFHNQMLFSFTSTVGIINISLTILVVFEYKRFRKTFIDFSNNIFQIEKGIR